MNNSTIPDVVKDVLGRTAEVPVTDISADGLSHAVSRLNEELYLELDGAELTGYHGSTIADLVADADLPIDKFGKTIFDIYEDLEKIAREELHQFIHYGWNGTWEQFLDDENFFLIPDPLDLAEVGNQIAKKFEIVIPVSHAPKVRTVADTVRYIWRRRV